MSELGKLFEAIGNRPLTICRDPDRWRAELRFRDLDIFAGGDSLAEVVRDTVRQVLDHAQSNERDSEEHARKARDEVARLRAIVGEAK